MPFTCDECGDEIDEYQHDLHGYCADCYPEGDLLEAVCPDCGGELSVDDDMGLPDYCPSCGWSS